MSQSKIKLTKPTFRPLAVIDFNCDVCLKPLDAVVVMQGRAVKMVAKAYHEECWKRDVLPTTKLSRSN